MGNAQRRATNTVSRQAQGFMSFARKIRKKKESPLFVFITFYFDTALQHFVKCTDKRTYI